ncbi:hypothetical protein HMI56_004953 [Coelomomyces lativittatus]|nr:hypothetical protein HMI56_004953 [Coelomomyces lativittatus]
MSYLKFFQKQKTKRSEKELDNFTLQSIAKRPSDEDTSVPYQTFSPPSATNSNNQTPTSSTRNLRTLFKRFSFFSLSGYLQTHRSKRSHSEDELSSNISSVSASIDESSDAGIPTQSIPSSHALSSLPIVESVNSHSNSVSEEVILYHQQSSTSSLPHVHYYNIYFLFSTLF